MKLVVALLLVSTVLAGCTDAEPKAPAADPGVPDLDLASAAIYDILPVVEEWLPMTDGKAMHHAVFLPDGDPQAHVHPDGSSGWPVFINFSPYWGDTAELGGDAFGQYMIQEYVPRGYAVVLAALRGTGHSEGCFQIGGDQELMDMHEVVDHYANAAWSNGHVATGGKSYDSSPTNGLIAKFPHPALKGVFHVSGITDMYAYNYKGGVPYATGPVFNTYYYLQGTDEYGVSLVGAGSADDEDAESLARVIDDAACAEMPLIQAHGVGSGASGMKTDYWVERDWTRYIGDSDWNGSIFFVHGLQDWNVKPDHILPWITELPDQIRVKGWLHQGGHVYPERQDWNHTMLAWMDAELKGHDNGFWDAPAWSIESDNGTYYDAQHWPAPLREVGKTTGSGDLSVTFDTPTRISGSIQAQMAYTSPNPDAVWTVSIYASTGGQVTWLSEAVLRAAYRESLDFPAAPDPTDTLFAALDSYPFDHVFQPGDTLMIRFQEEPRNVLVTPTQLAGVEVTSATILAPMDTVTPSPHQPASMRCFAC